MTQTRTLGDYLNAAGIKVAAAPAPAAAAAPAKTAAAAPAKTAAPAAKPAVKVADNTAKTKVDGGSDTASQPAAGGDASAKTPRKTSDEGKTAEQKWLEERGVIVADAKIAEQLVAREIKIAEQAKHAELEKLAEEERCRGAIFYQGMVKESTAMQLALGQCDMKTAEMTARLIGVHADAIVKRAEELAAAVGHPALIGTDEGRAARISDSRTMAAADQNGNTTRFEPEAASATRAPVSGQDEKTLRFVDVWALPGNPGLSHGQQVDQGKGL